MTIEEFVDTILSYYKEGRKLTVNPEKYNIWRGVSHTVSSKAEDLFALFVAKTLDDESLEFIVDKPWSYKVEGKRTIQFRPDLAIVKNGVLTHIFDLKMDMGYKRRYHETDSFLRAAKNFQRFRGEENLTVQYKNKIKHKYIVSNKIVNQIVVLTTANGGKASNREDMVKAIEDLPWTNLYYLTEGVHLNNYEDAKPRINEHEFQRLFNDITENLI